MNELNQAIQLQALYVFTNLFLSRMSKEVMVTELKGSDAIFRQFRRVMDKRHPNNPWLYYGVRY